MSKKFNAHSPSFFFLFLILVSKLFRFRRQGNPRTSVISHQIRLYSSTPVFCSAALQLTSTTKADDWFSRPRIDFLINSLSPSSCWIYLGSPGFCSRTAFSLTIPENRLIQIQLRYRTFVRISIFDACLFHSFNLASDLRTIRYSWLPL